MADQPSPRCRFQFRLRTLMIGVTLLSLAVGCGQSEPLPNAAVASTPSQQLCAKFIRQAMGSNEVRFKDLGETKTIKVGVGDGTVPVKEVVVSWEVRKNDYWEQHQTRILFQPEQIELGKQYSAFGDVEGLLWITEADAKDVIPQLPSGDSARSPR